MAITSPLLEIDVTGARKVLYNVISAGDLGLNELNMAAKVIQEMVDPEAEIIFGTAIDPSLDGDVQITVIATGFDKPLPPPVAEDGERWSSEMLSEMGLDAEDVELPAFLRRQRTYAVSSSHAAGEATPRSRASDPSLRAMRPSSEATPAGVASLRVRAIGSSPVPSRAPEEYGTSAHESQQRRTAKRCGTPLP